MQKNKKSKKERLEKLRIILDNPSNRDLHPEDEKYLEALRRRLVGSSKESAVYIYRSSKSKEYIEERIDPLKPQVKIYQKEEKKEFVAPEIKHIEPEEKPEKQEESLYEDKELYEVEKVEGPEFLEVRPKEITEKKEKVSTVEIEESQKITDSKIKDTVEDKKNIEDEKLPEWETVETKKPEVAEVEEIKEEKTKPEMQEVPSPAEKKKDDSTGWESVDVEKAKDGGKSEFEEKAFLPIEKKEGEELKLGIPEEKPEFKEEISEQKEESIPEEKREEETPGIDRDGKINIFREIKSINEETAVLLYDNGFTSIDAVMKTSLKDLTRIKGIKKKLAKNIKKEIEQKLEGSATKTKKETGEYFILDEEFYKDESKKIDEGILKHEVAEEDKDFFEDEKEGKFIEEDKKINVFRGISNIDEKTASLLYENGITSIDILREKSIRELTRIKGIRRKLAKRIKKEIESMDRKTEDAKKIDEKSAYSRKDEPFIEEKAEEEWESYSIDEVPEQRLKDKGYTYEDYTLYKKEIKTTAGKKRFVHFFSKAEPAEGEPSELPAGFEVKTNKKTGVPYLKKKK